MTQKTIKISIDKIYSKSPKNKYNTNKTDVFHIGKLFRLDILDQKEYDPDKNRGYRYVLVVINNFSKIGRIIPLKNKNAQTIKKLL